jgi:acyl-CoA synthetase (NDP forming)
MPAGWVVEAMPQTDGWERAAVPSLGAVPDEVDLVVIAVPPRRATVARTCAARGAKAMVVLSAGFAEASAARPPVSRSCCRSRGAGMRLVGPTASGCSTRRSASMPPFHAARPTRGVPDQSGGLGIALIEWSRDVGVGLSMFVSMGNRADVSANDLIEHWGADPAIGCILLYLESFGNPRNSPIARRVAVKPIVVEVRSHHRARAPKLALGGAGTSPPRRCRVGPVRAGGHHPSTR